MPEVLLSTSPLTLERNIIADRTNKAPCIAFHFAGAIKFASSHAGDGIVVDGLLVFAVQYVPVLLC